MREKLTELLGKLHAAKGPDRELDAMLCQGMSLEPWTGWWRTQSPAFASGSNLDLETPHLTGSIDAALALLDKQLSGIIDVSWSYESSDAAVWPAATVRWYPIPSDERGWRAEIGSAASIPLAICSAALKALLAQTEASDGR